MTQPFSAPGNLTDFKTDQQRKGWSDNVSQLFDDTVASITGCVAAGSIQFVNPAKVDTSAYTRSDISWSGFPNSLMAQGGPGGTPLTPNQAFAAADQPGTGGRFTQDEYLEWFVHRDGNGNIVAIDFTTETEHYWETLYGLDKDLTASLYTELVGTKVVATDIGKGNKYEPLNKFNTTGGIVHLIHPANTLGAELDIACQSTRARNDDGGQPTDDVVDCLRCSSSDPIGGDTRNSDPHIASTVAGVAEQGSRLTIPDPVGLYIARLDTTGWVTPDGSDPQLCWSIVRGAPAVRARFSVPANKFKISDITIAGQNIQFAGQIAQRVFVKLTAAIGPQNEIKNRPRSPCTGGPAAHAAAAARPGLHTRTRRTR